MIVERREEVLFPAKCPVCGKPVEVPYYKKSDGEGGFTFAAAFPLFPVHDDCHGPFLDLQRKRGLGARLDR